MKTFILSIVLLFGVSLSCKTSVNTEKKQTEVKSDKIITEKVSFTTTDNINIKGDYYFNQGKTDTREPLVILIHQFKSDRKQWSKSFIDSLVNNQYKVIAYDIRSHGESGKATVEIDDILKNIEQAPKDLDAIFLWAKSQKGIDSSKIAVIGTSIGGSLAFYAKYFLNAKTIIGISVGKNTFENMTGFYEMRMGMMVQRVRFVYLICGDKDGEYASDNKYISDNFLDPPMDMKLYKSAMHGRKLIEENPEIYSECLNWLKKNL